MNNPLTQHLDQLEPSIGLETSNSPSPLSPRILLSPSSPDFPAVDLPLPLPEHTSPKDNKKLRQSLLLLDSRLAELKTIAQGGGLEQPSTKSKTSENVDAGNNEEEGPVNFMLARGSFAGGANKRELSSRSLASVASGTSSHRSSEDAFDIVDFPSIEQISLSSNHNLGLAISTRLPPSPRNRSSDLMAFPIPPSDISLIPIRNGESSSNTSLEGDQVFEHLASLGGGDGQPVQGLGLYSSSSVSRPPSRLARSETETDSACSHQSSFLETSTLASSYAATLGFGRSTTSFKAFGKEETPSTSPLFARRMANSNSPISPPPMIFTSGSDTTPGVPATLGSPFSLHQEFPPSTASLSPFSFTESPRQSPTLTSQSLAELPFRTSSFPSPTFSSPTPSLSRSSSRQDFGFAELHQASVGLLGSFDGDGIPCWEVGEGDNYGGSTARRKEEEDEDQLEVLQDLAPPSNHRSDRSSSVQGSPLGTLRRLSSFQILRRRKSDNVLTANPPPVRPVLSKPKSEAALSTLARRQGVCETGIVQKENLATTELPPNRLRMSLRSKSSPRLSKLALESGKTTSTPKNQKEGRPLLSPSPGSTTRKRFSIFGSKQSHNSQTESIPPVPTTPTEHLPPRTSSSPVVVSPSTPVSLVSAAKPTTGDSITLANFLESTSPKAHAKGNESRSPLGDRTNWSRPTSPALLDALKPVSPLDSNDLVTVPQRITVFPVRLPPPSKGALAAAKRQEEVEEKEGGQDSYGDESDSEEDKPLGVTVPGALTAQKSLRKTMSTKKLKSRPKEDPFEFEQAAAILKSQNMSRNASTSTSISTRETSNKSSQGHDSFLPQTDASIARKASSNGLRRSPSTPLDPMIADSALTIDSPLLFQEPLPAPVRRNSRPGTTTSESNSSPPVAPPRSRPPPIPTHPSRQADQEGSRIAPPLSRRPSLHPDIANIQTSSNMQRQASNSSKSAAHSIPVASSDSSVPAPRPSPGVRSRSGTMPSAALPSLDYRVYLGRPGAKHLTIKVTDRTVAGEVVAFAKAKGALEGGKESEGGWALWEIWQSMGLERPIREYELLNDLIKSFDGDSGVFVLRRTTLWPLLSVHARPHPVAPKLAQVQLELKKGKWSKRYLELKDGALIHSKSEKGKDSTILCQLSNFSVFYVDEATTLRLKAPKPFVFALKSRLTRANFEEVSQYCNFLSVKSAGELENWITSITEAGNPLFRQREQAVLGVSSSPSLPSPPLLSSGSQPSSTPFTSISQEPASVSEALSSRGFLARASSSRPAPAVLTPANGENLPPKRRPTVSKPLVDLSR